MKSYLIGASLQVGIALVSYGTITANSETAQAPEKPAVAERRVLPSTTRITRTADLSTMSPSDAKFTVVCEIVSESLSFHTPQVTVRDGERLRLSDCSESDYTVAVLEDGDHALPITRKLVEGSVFELTVLSIDDEQVLVDVAATLQSVDSKPPQDAPQPIRVNTLQGRFIEPVRLGEKASATFGDSFGDKDGWSLQITVQEDQESDRESGE